MLKRIPIILILITVSAFAQPQHSTNSSCVILACKARLQVLQYLTSACEPKWGGGFRKFLANNQEQLIQCMQQKKEQTPFTPTEIVTGVSNNLKDINIILSGMLKNWTHAQPSNYTELPNKHNIQQRIQLLIENLSHMIADLPACQ